MVETLRDGKKLMPLGSGTVLLIGVRGDEKNVYICNTGESPLDTNDTVILAQTEIDELVFTLLAVKKSINDKEAA